MGRYSSRRRSYGGSYGDWRPYVPMHERRRQAAAKLAKMKKSGHEPCPVEIEGRKIATTFWGQAWCENLEAYSDYANRLPRGRTYVRNGSVIDLQIEAGKIHALVCGTSIYTVDITITSLPPPRWAAIKKACGGQIGSLVELLQGRISGAVMQVVSQRGEGLFPSPKEISLRCSCPDWATLCKHVAATLYGVGARLDHSPELLFTLRGVDPTELVEAAVSQAPARGASARDHALATDALSDIFGVDIDLGEEVVARPTDPLPATPKASRGRSTKRRLAEPQAAAPKAETSKVRASKAAASKAAAPKAAAPKAAASKAAAPKAAAPKARASKAAASKAAASKAAAPKAAAPKAKTSKATASKAAASKAAARRAVEAEPSGHRAAKRRPATSEGEKSKAAESNTAELKAQTPRPTGRRKVEPQPAETKQQQKRRRASDTRQDE